MRNPVLALDYFFRKTPMGRQAYRPHPTDEPLSTVHMLSQHMHCGGIWVLTQVYLEQKLAIEVLLPYRS